MSVIPWRRIGEEYNFTDIVLLAVEGVKALITQAQEWNLIPNNEEIRCPATGCLGKLKIVPLESLMDREM
jgi:hypothetical protein